MFRTAILRATRAVRPAAVRPVAARWAAPRFIAPAKPAAYTMGVRYYSAPAGLSKEEVEGRIKDLLKGFDKVTDETAVNGQSHFTKDLGLDSLDTVEVVMAIEEEFSIEIPDKDADNIHSVDQAVQYIISQPDAH
ncbi:putative acyl carrier protein [Geopyxis carbonaria]|nr:putative acyl carrier protein [Geopyxis carbonaria]